MSNETIKKFGLPSSSCKDDDKSHSSVKPKLIPNSTSNAPISVLSPHVAEFVPKSFALKKESSSSPKSAKCVGESSSLEVPWSDIQGVKKLDEKPGDCGEHSSRGWWEETPLKIEHDETFIRNAPKPHHHMKGPTERTHRQPRQKTAASSWRQDQLSEDLNFNWRLRPSHTDQEKSKNNELGFQKDRKEISKIYSLSSSFEGRKVRNESRSHKEGIKTASGVMEGEQQEHRRQQGTVRRGASRGKGRGRGRTAWQDQNNQNYEPKDFNNSEGIKTALGVMENEQEKHQRQQGSVRRGASRGRGRGKGRMAWMNDTQHQNNQDYEPKDFNISDEQDIKKVGHGHGFRSNTFNHIEPAVPKGTSNSGNIMTSSKHNDPEFLMRKEKETDRSSTAEDDGWIVIGNKKKMDEQKDSGRKRKEKMSTENQFSGKSKEMNERDDKMTVLNSQQKMEKWKRKRDQKKERNEQEGRTVQNKQTTPEIKTAKKFSKQDESHKEKSKVVLKTEKDGSGSMESESKSNKNKQEKEPKKAEIVKIIKTEQNSNKKEVKILLKKNNSQVPGHDEQMIPNDPGFDLYEGDDEFPDLAASSKGGSTSLASDWLSGGSRMPIVSYSAVLKAMPKPRTHPMKNLPDNERGSSTTTQDHDENEGQSKKKKKKKKKKAKDGDGNAKPAPQEPKKTKQPMQFDLGDWLSTIEKSPPKINKDKQPNPKKAVTIATGVLQINAKDKPSATSHAPAVKATHGLSTTDKTFHNILDSTAPVVKRGKEREVPKKKKPSQLKRIILKEREEKRKALEGEETPEEKSEPKSLVEEHSSSEETKDEHNSEDKLPNEDNEVTVNQSKDEVINHHHGNTNGATPADLDSDADQAVAPSEDDVKAQIHSRRFREYCDNVMDKELNNTTLQLLQKLVMFQDRQYHKDPVKSKAKRRYVVGLREVTKHLKLKKIKLVIISPNVERIKSAGGLDDTLHNIISIAHQNGVPVVFALRRQVLGRVLHKKVPVSALGVFYYDGAEDEYKKLMDLTEKAREVYAQRWKAAYDELVEKIHKERAEEMLQDAQEECSSAHDQYKEEPPTELPNEIKNDIKKENDTISKDTNDSNIIGMRKMEKDKESEIFNTNQENEWEKESEMKNEPLDEEEHNTEESDDDNELEAGNTGIEKVEQDETNEINEQDNDSPCGSSERDWTVEEL